MTTYTNLELNGYKITLGPAADAAIKEAREQGVLS